MNDEALRAKARGLCGRIFGDGSPCMDERPCLPCEAILAALRDVADEREREVRAQVERDFIAALTITTTPNRKET